MEWRSESVPAWASRIEKWHLWFAWYPVRVGESMVWLETVERIGTVHFTPYNDTFAIYRYRKPATTEEPKK